MGRLVYPGRKSISRFCAAFAITLIEHGAGPNGGSARDYLPGFAWFGAPLSGPTRERLSVCLFIGGLGVNFRICRESRVRAGHGGQVTPAGLPL
jgi:hypothetical protein